MFHECLLLGYVSSMLLSISQLAGKAINESKKMTSRKGSTKNKKKIEISSPSNFEHRVHTGYDALQGEFTDLPKQWTGVISPKSRPQPFVDPNAITPVSNVRVSRIV